MNVIQLPESDLPYGTEPGAPHSDIRTPHSDIGPTLRYTILVFTYIWQEEVGDNPQSSKGPAQCKSGPGVTWLAGVTIYCTIFH